MLFVVMIVISWLFDRKEWTVLNSSLDQFWFREGVIDKSPKGALRIKLQ